jgi:hypothetical protein
MNNDLIKQFARQAGFKVNWQHEDVQAIKMAQYKEFAELIVEECRNVLTDVYREVPLECSGHLLYADEVIAKHFYGEKE